MAGLQCRTCSGDNGVEVINKFERVTADDEEFEKKVASSCKAI